MVRVGLGTSPWSRTPCSGWKEIPWPLSAASPEVVDLVVVDVGSIIIHTLLA